jgi:predicted CoA-binding protein
MSGKPDKQALQSVSQLPSDIDCAVIGVTKRNPADVMEDLEKKGIKKFWIHWRTETPEVKKRCGESQIQCITGRCPMMYLGHGINIHTMHRGIAKLMGKY